MALLKRLVSRSALGAHVPHRKNTEEFETVKCAVPAKAYYPMSMHIGAPAQPTVEKGDAVKVGTLIGKAGGFVSADIHSGVSGTVAGIEEIMMPSGAMVKTVVIDSDGLQAVDEAVAPPKVIDYKSFTAAIQASGLVGLGGAGFPTHVKLMPKNLDAIEYLVINGAECEPYITADYREFMENPQHVLNGVRLVQKYLGIKKAIIAIERNKPKAIDLMLSLTKDDASIEVKALESQYPQGAEKILIEKTTGREVPRGGLPSDVGVIALNVATVSFISKYLETGMPLITKRLTVDGGAVKEAKNVEAIIGTPVKDVIEFCGGYVGEAGKIISGGPMMGIALVNDSLPILKQNNAILVFTEQEAKLPRDSACIRCGRCINGCPMGLSPVEISEQYQNRSIEGLNELYTELCMECGCCSFVCPAKRPLTQTMRLAKAEQRKGGAK